ncbi:hypothetical protein C4J81_15355 [Deltaproteobacteria bacterium Smac51]|nr:hypothetical protein C4J81_10090 [Deltaproteobacteria bacterium Smac51]UQZ90508.1 hypothetical protein C4J81_15355 [Deltaproteobacteria bacterium Smac51]
MSDLYRAGVVKVAINGQRVDINASGLRYSFGGVKLTEVVGADEFHGFSGEVVPAFIEFTVTDHKKLDVEALLNLEDATVTVVLFNKKTLVLSNASNTSDRTGQSSDGAITMRMVGTSLKELKAV